MRRERLRWLVAGALIATLLATAANLWHRAARQPQVNFLPQRSPAAWIVYPAAPDTQEHPRALLAATFRRTFQIQSRPQHANLKVAGSRSFNTKINGSRVSAPVATDRNWKIPASFDIAALLQQGENEIEVEVLNSNGPPALWLSLEADDFALHSDSSWRVSWAGATWKTAKGASEPRLARPGNPCLGGETLLACLQNYWSTLAALAAVAMLVAWWSERMTAATLAISGNHARRQELWIVLGCAVLWVALFLNNLRNLPPLTGFDVDGHLAYIRYIQDHLALPVASEGWEMYQPPLYYAFCAGLLELFGLSAGTSASVTVIRLSGLALGLAQIWLNWASLRLLFPSSDLARRTGVLLASFLPPLVYISHYVTNEGAAAALVSVTVFVCLRILKAPAPSAMLHVILGVCLGAALLTKVTALLMLPAVLGALLLKQLNEDRLAWRRWARDVAIVLAVCVVICGWFYARAWIHFGSPVVGVWDSRTGFSWWQDPGYQTSSYFLNLGNPLSKPWYSGMTSFFAGLYGTLWGDGLLGGASAFAHRPPWNFGLMMVGYWLALLPMTALLIGSALAVRKFLRELSAEWFLLLSLAGAMAVSMVKLALEAPYYSHVKAHFGLAALIPVCALAGLSFDALSCRSKRMRIVLLGALVFWGLNTYASFWSRDSSVETQLARLRQMMEENRLPEAAAHALRLVAVAPGNSEASFWQASVLLAMGNRSEALHQAEESVKRQPDSGNCQLALAIALAESGQLARAITAASRAISLEPENREAYLRLGRLLLRGGDMRQAAQVCRDGLAAYPTSGELQELLSQALKSEAGSVSPY